MIVLGINWLAMYLLIEQLENRIRLPLYPSTHSYASRDYTVTSMDTALFIMGAIMLKCRRTS